MISLLSCTNQQCSHTNYFYWPESVGLLLFSFGESGLFDKCQTKVSLFLFSFLSWYPLKVLHRREVSFYKYKRKEFLPFNRLQVEYFKAIGMVIKLFYKVFQDVNMSVMRCIMKDSPEVAWFGNFLHERILLILNNVLKIFECSFGGGVVEFHFFRYWVNLGEESLASVFSNFLIEGRST